MRSPTEFVVLFYHSDAYGVAQPDYVQHGIWFIKQMYIMTNNEHRSPVYNVILSEHGHAFAVLLIAFVIADGYEVESWYRR